MKRPLLYLASASLLVVTSCVSTKRHAAALGTVERLRLDSASFAARNAALVADINRIQREMDDLRRQDVLLSEDLTHAQQRIAQLNAAFALPEHEAVAKGRHLDLILATHESLRRRLVRLAKKVDGALSDLPSSQVLVNTGPGTIRVTLSDSLLFAGDEVTLGVKGSQVLDRIAKVWAANKDLECSAEGHYDPTSGNGPPGIALARAHAAAQRLAMTAGIPPSSILLSARARAKDASLISPLDPPHGIELVFTAGQADLYGLLGRKPGQLP